MSDIISIADHINFKTVAEWREFAEKQMLSITVLQGQLEVAREEITHLQKLLVQASPLVGQGSVEKIIISPEQALLDDQILMIQQRAYAKELSLEDVKKLDILLKNKKLIKDEGDVLSGQSKKIALSNDDLLKIVQNDSPK